MATAIRISEGLVDEARKYSRIDHRSITGQIEHWARIGKCAEENPDFRRCTTGGEHLAAHRGVGLAYVDGCDVGYDRRYGVVVDNKTCAGPVAEAGSSGVVREPQEEILATRLVGVIAIDYYRHGL